MIQASTFRHPVVGRRDPSIPADFEEHDRVLSESLRLDGGGEARVASIPYERRRLTNTLAMAASDAAGLFATVAVAVGLRGLLGASMTWPTWPTWAVGFVLAWIFAAAIQHLYPGWGLGVADELRNITRSTVGAAAATAIGLVLIKGAQYESRFILIATAVMALVTMPLSRAMARGLLVRIGKWGINVAVYGTTSAVRKVVFLLQDQPHVGLRPVAIFDDDARQWGHDVNGVPVIGETHLVYPDAPAAIVAGSADGSRPGRMDVLRYYRRVLRIGDAAEQSSLVSRTVDIGGLLGVEIQVNLASPLARLVKRTLDLALVTLASPFWLPVLGFGIVATWLEDRHNPFFVQRRMGRGGHSIRVLKLRTMRPDAETVLQKALAEDESLRIEWDATCKLQKDPRITRVGWILRRLSIDELPQLINVLRGDMSLIGPRPLPRYHEQRLPEAARAVRRRVRPGLSGLWQVSGRSDTGNEAMAWLDAYYVRNWSLWIDLAILSRTVRVAVAGSGAY